MNAIVFLIIFFIVLFFYIHIYYHLKTSSDLEVYELDHTNNPEFETIGNSRQPLIFPNTSLNEIYNHFNIKNLIDHFPHFDIQLRNASTQLLNPNMHLYKYFTFQNAIKMIKSNSSVFSENNLSFLQESCLSKIIKQNDAFLRPPFLTYSHYDIIIGSGCTTPLRYDTCFKHYIIPIEDQIEIKLTPPKYQSYMNLQKDYEYFQFYTNDNLWKSDYNKKIKSINIILNPGQILLIPSYWMYTCYFFKPNLLLSLKYYSFMNLVSISPEILMYLFQQQNIKYKTNCQIIKPSKAQPHDQLPAKLVKDKSQI